MKSTDGDVGSVNWTFDPPGFDPTHLSFRIHNVFDGWSDPANCIPMATEQPLTVDVQLRDGELDADVGQVRVSEIVSQDYSRPEFPLNAACSNRQFLHTVRIPISCFPPLDVQALNSVQFVFGNDPGAAEGSIVLDSIEFTRSDEDAGGMPDCSEFEEIPVTTSFLCEYYDPADHIDFTIDPGAGPGDPEGVITMDASFARYVASRPEMVTGCDNARYELDTVSVDSDSDGTADSTEDVRAIERIQPTDLVAQLGLEDFDAAITINEPGKPDTNGVELYDFDSFIAAYRRFGALQNLEIRLLREQSGVHQPVLLDSQLPPDISGIEPPQAPAGPSTYALPTGATTVSNSADLIAELALPNAHDVIVADGDYAWTGPVTVAGPHRVWSDTLHGATIHFGLTYAGNADRTDGLELHGLDFQLDNASMAPAGVGLGFPRKSGHLG